MIKEDLLEEYCRRYDNRFGSVEYENEDTFHINIIFRHYYYEGGERVLYCSKNEKINKTKFNNFLMSKRIEKIKRIKECLK